MKRFFKKTIDVSLYQSGFPYIISSQVITTPAIVDIDFDNNKEIIFGVYPGADNIEGDAMISSDVSMLKINSPLEFIE